MSFTPEQFRQAKESAEALYRAIGRVRRPYFQEDVHIDTEGWEHLEKKEWNKPRTTQDQYMRFRLFRFVLEILETTRTLQGAWETKAFIRMKSGHQWVRTLKTVTYYEFIAIVDLCGQPARIKIIVKQIEGAQKHFLSIIPFWRQSLNGRILHDGNPEQD